MSLSRWIAGKVAREPAGFTRYIVRIAQVAVALSLCVMLISTAMIRGFKSQISDKVFSFWGHIHITDATITRVLEELPITLPQPFYPLSAPNQKAISFSTPLSFLGWESENYLIRKKTKGGIRHIQSFATAAGIIKTKSDIEGILLKGVAADYDWALMQPFILEGRPVQMRTDTAARRDIMISKQTADRLEVKLGSVFSLYFVREGQQIQRGYKVCGIYKTGLEEYDRKFAIVSMDEIQALSGWTAQQVGGFEIFLSDYRDMEPWADYLQQSSLVPNSCYVQTIKDKFPAIFDWLQLQDLNEWVILVLLTLVAIINMTTAILILILERTKMIGVLKSLGSRNSIIRGVFLNYAARVLIVGMLFGNILGLGLAFLQQKFRFLKLPEADYYLSEVPISFHVPSILLINAATFIVTMTFLTLPALYVARLSPLKALKFD